MEKTSQLIPHRIVYDRFRFTRWIVGVAVVVPALGWSSTDGAGMRGSIGMGPWAAKFSQSDGSHESKVTSLPSLGVNTQLGVQVSMFFAEYTLTWLIAPYGPNPKLRDASYFSPLGMNAGVTLPILPMDLYVGVERGGFGLSGGVKPSYGGVAVKLGVNLYLSGGEKKVGIGVKGEFRRIFISSDDAGSLPSNFSTRADTFFLGFLFGGH